MDDPRDDRRPKGGDLSPAAPQAGHKQDPKSNRGPGPVGGHKGDSREGPGRPLGFSEHVIVGRIVETSSGMVNSSKVVNCRVAVRPWLKRVNLKSTTWYEVSIWETQAYAFEKLNFKVGDQVLFRLDNIRAEAWVDSRGNPHAAIKGAADKFFDLRPTQGVCQELAKELELEASAVKPSPAFDPPGPSAGVSPGPSGGPSSGPSSGYSPGPSRSPAEGETDGPDPAAPRWPPLKY